MAEPIRSNWPNVSPSPFAPLQFELMQTFPRGGTFSGHAPLCFDTDLFLRATQCRYVVNLRHPADFVVALYCHGTDERLGRFIPSDLYARIDRPAMKHGARWAYALSAFKASIFDGATPFDEAIAHMLRDGVLFKAMADARLACSSRSRAVDGVHI